MNEEALQPDVLPSTIRLPEGLSEEKIDLLVALLQKYHNKFDQLSITPDKKN